MNKLKLAMIVLSLSIVHIEAQGFCGFYVAKADAKLFNETSQVIMARDGNQTTVTMSNDYKGKMSEFAMVVPVPVVLQRNDIKTVDKSLFTKLDDYSAPRMAMYYDQNPCPYVINDSIFVTYNGLWATDATTMTLCAGASVDFNVTIEAEYKVDEYDILILSATESSGLEKWLKINGYKIPDGAEEVLHPYIKNNMKFFVVKVNLARLEAMGSNEIKPLQIRYSSEKFMLPIRLGMANSNGDQDMIVYALSKKGRVETTNYRNVKIPTDKNVPYDIQSKFASFYKDVFDHTYKQNNGKVTFLEYAWDVSKRTQVKCDPCVGTPPVDENLLAAGVSQKWIDDANSPVFFTRMHIRYNRQNFPQDLMFQETTNQERFQGRYVIHTPANVYGGNFGCEEGQKYCKEIKQRRKEEVLELAFLTGKDVSNYTNYIMEYDKYIKKDETKGETAPIAIPGNNWPNGGSSLFVIFLVTIGGLIMFIRPKKDILIVGTENI